VYCNFIITSGDWRKTIRNWCQVGLPIAEQRTCTGCKKTMARSSHSGEVSSTLILKMYKLLNRKLYYLEICLYFVGNLLSRKYSASPRLCTVLHGKFGQIIWSRLCTNKGTQLSSIYFFKERFYLFVFWRRHNISCWLSWYWNLHTVWGCQLAAEQEPFLLKTLGDH